MPLAKEGTYYTYADYLEWDEGIRCEIIEGEALMIAPFPYTPGNQRGNISQDREFFGGETLQGVYEALRGPLEPAKGHNVKILRPSR
jgi:hypothetical protein